MIFLHGNCKKTRQASKYSAFSLTPWSRRKSKNNIRGMNKEKVLKLTYSLSETSEDNTLHDVRPIVSYVTGEIVRLLYFK